ncbi:MAG: flavin reductase family protein [Asticcacaulis sp.]
MHAPISPAILYAGTPVVVLSTCNADDSVNLAPMSSVWWLGWSCMLGLDASSKTVENLRRTGECVLNLASVETVQQVNRLAKTSGSNPLPAHKQALGYRFEPDKLGTSGFSTHASETVRPPRLNECPITMEAKAVAFHPFAGSDPRTSIPLCAVELTILAVFAHDSVRTPGHPDRIDPDQWRPLIMSFRRFYGLGGECAPSTLSEGPEEYYAPWKFMPKS